MLFAIDSVTLLARPRRAGYNAPVPWRRTPAWISLGGAWLSLSAGYVNAVGFLGTHEHGVTHVTGQVTRIGIELAEADFTGTFDAAMLVVWFFLGAVLSGAIIRRAELSKRGRRYGVAMLVEAGLLVLATSFLIRRADWGFNLVAMAAGLQNAMATSYSGAVVRTTHMTGIATDLGILIGHTLRGHAPEWEKLKLLGILFSAFLTGGVLGGWVFPHLGAYSLLPPATAMTLASAAYFYLTHRDPEPHAHPPT